MPAMPPSGRDRAAVVAVAAADDEAAFRLPGHVPVAAHHAHHGVVGLRARAGEKHVLEPRRRQFGQQRGKLHRGDVGGVEEAVIERQRFHLAVDRFRDAGAPVADIYAPQSRHRVDDLVPVRVPQVDALAAHHHARPSLAQRRMVRERMQVVRRVELLQRARVERFLGRDAR
jgi:hypothetical protein